MLTCQVCGESVERLNRDRCDQCWDDLANGRDPRKRKKLGEPSGPDSPKVAALEDRARSLIKALEGMGPAAVAMAASFREAAAKFGIGPTQEVLDELEQAIKEEAVRQVIDEVGGPKALADYIAASPQDALQKLLDARYVAGNPDWKKLAGPRPDPNAVARWDPKHPRNRSPAAELGAIAERIHNAGIPGANFGTIQEQVEGDVGTDGKPIPGKAFREAYIQTHTPPDNWPEYDLIRREAASKRGGLEASEQVRNLEDGEIDQAIIGVTPRGLLQIRTSRGYRFVAPSSLSQETGDQNPNRGKIAAQYDLSQGVKHSAILTPVQLAGVHTWLRGQGRGNSAKAKLAGSQGKPPTTWELGLVDNQGRLILRNATTGGVVHLKGEKIGKPSPNETTYSYDIRGYGFSTDTCIRTTPDPGTGPGTDPIYEAKAETPGERVVRQLKAVDAKREAKA